MKKGKLPRYVRAKRAKGRVYLYFDTGRADDRGRPILQRLPGLDDPTFGVALGRARAAREGRANVARQLTVAGLIALYEKSPHFAALALKSRDVFRTYLGQIERRVGKAPADDLTPSDVNFIRDEMADRPGAANQFIRTLGSLYSWGRSRQHVSADPVKDVELFAQGEHAPWPDELIEAALVDEDATIRTGVALLYFTAQRIGDVVNFPRSAVVGGVLKVRQGKTGKELEIPLHRRLAAVLARAPKDGLTLLCVNGRPLGPVALRVRLQKWAAERGFKVVAHGLRKSAVNALLEAGCSVAETSAISGQSLQMVEHYAKKRNVGKLAKAAILRWERKK